MVVERRDRKLGKVLVERGIVAQEILDESFALLEEAPEGGPGLLPLLEQLGHISAETRKKLEAKLATRKVDGPEAEDRRPQPEPTEERPSRRAPETRTENRPPRETRRKKPALTPKQKLIQAAIFFSPVLILAIVVAMRISNSRATPDDPAPPAAGPDKIASTDPPADPPPVEGDLDDPPPVRPEPRSTFHEQMDRAERDLARKDLDAVEARRGLERLATRLDEALASDPSDADALFLRGRARFLLDDLTAARRDLDALIERQPGHGGARLERARLDFLLLWRTMLALGAWWEKPALWPDCGHFQALQADAAVAASSSDREIASRADVFLAWCQMGPAKALEALDRILAGGADDGELHFLRGVFLHQDAWSLPGRPSRDLQRMLVLVLQEHRASVERRWHRGEGWFHLSLALYDNEERDEAARTLDALAERTPRDSLVHLTRGVFHLVKSRELAAQRSLQGVEGALRAAWGSFERALDIDPDCLQAKYFRAAMLFDQGRHRDAAAELNPVLSVNSMHVQGQILLVQILEAMGHAEAVVDNASTVLLLRDGLWDVYLMRARALRKLGRVDEARADFEKVLSLSPPDPVRQEVEEALSGK